MTIEGKLSVEKNNQEEDGSDTNDLQPGKIEINISHNGCSFVIRGPEAAVHKVLGQLNSERFPKLFPPSFKF